MKKVAFYTLGCKLNFSETSTIGRLFESAGYQKAAFENGADIYIINTCSVTDNADKKCKRVVKEALRISPNAFIAIIGCYAQLKPEEIASIPGVDAVLGASEKFRLIELLGTFEKKEKPLIFKSNIAEVKDFYCSFSAQDRTRTFLKVQDGCNYVCSFCTIPKARGTSRSDTLENILYTAQEIAKTDVKEVVLTGVNIGDVGIIDGQRHYNFLDLIQQLDGIDGIGRYRISSIEPNLLTEDIIKFVASSDKFTPHFHIPLQSGSDAVLKLMRRRYNKDLYRNKINEIKALIPHCCIGVDVIVGFPGETDALFFETYEFLSALPISYLHVFTYSERPDTMASTLPLSVPMGERNKRSNMLRILSDKKKRAFYEQQVGKTLTALLEQDAERGIMHGFTENYTKVAFPYDPLLVNEFLKVKITHINADGVAEVQQVEELVPSIANL